MSVAEEKYEKERNRWKALEQFYHALRYNRTLYNRPSLDWFFEAFDAMDEEGVEVMTRQQFCNACYDLGLGMSTTDLQRLVEVLDEGGKQKSDGKKYRLVQARRNDGQNFATAASARCMGRPMGKRSLSPSKIWQLLCPLSLSKSARSRVRTFFSSKMGANCEIARLAKSSRFLSLMGPTISS